MFSFEITTEISIIILFLVLIISTILTVKFKQPYVFWLLILGSIVGPFGFKLISDSSLINSIAEIGSILLLFTLGVKFSVQKLIKQGISPIIITSIKIFAISILFFFIISLFGFTFKNALFLSLITAITSTAIVVKIIEQRGWMDSDEVNFIINILIIEDIIAVILLTFISGFNDITFYSVIFQLIKTILLLIFIYFFSLYGVVPFTKWVIKNSNEDVTPFIAIVLAVGLSYLTSRIGLSASAGAFLAGSMIRYLPNSLEFETSISSFTLVFSSIFFLSVGMLVDLKILTSINLIIIVAILSLLAIIVKLAVSSVLPFFYGLNVKKSVFVGIVLIPIGEFSLLIAREAQKIGIDLIPITSMLIMFTALLTPIILRYENNITKLINNTISTRIMDKMESLQKIIKN